MGKDGCCLGRAPRLLQKDRHCSIMGNMNEYEERLREDALACGYEVLRKGWPDFVLVRGTEVIFVEVKPPVFHAGWSGHYLSVDQLRMAKVLEGLGLKVRVTIAGELGDLQDLDAYIEICKRRVVRREADGHGRGRVVPVSKLEGIG